MPYYDYEHPKTKKVKSIFQHMNDVHTYSESGVEWKRIWTNPQAVIDAKPDVFSENAYYNKLDNTKGTVGDAWERSAEWSDKRANKRDGADPVKAKLYEDFKKKTKKTHPQELKERRDKLHVQI